MKKIGITTTVPIEVLIAAGYTPVDLNNIFVVSDDYSKYIELAERDGFPKSMCAWIKGIYGACLENNINELIGVVEGDCSNTNSMLEVLELKGIKVYPFSYPHSHSYEDVKSKINNFINIFNTNIEDVENIRKKLNIIRKYGLELDQLTYIDNKASGFENHLFLVSFSDFNFDIKKFEEDIINKIKEIKNRKSNNDKLRIGYLGVPPMTSDIYSFVEDFNARFVYNEVQREFSFPRFENNQNIYDQYFDYTYPYDNKFRLKDIKKQIKERKLDAIIHYTQAFCHRAIDDIIIKANLDVPILNIEGDKLNKLDARTKLRIEAFLDMVSDQKEFE